MRAVRFIVSALTIGLVILAAVGWINLEIRRNAEAQTLGFAGHSDRSQAASYGFENDAEGWKRKKAALLVEKATREAKEQAARERDELKSYACIHAESAVKSDLEGPRDG